jgi:hypothetical protein
MELYITARLKAEDINSYTKEVKKIITNLD